MNITNDLVQRSNGLLNIKPEINDWTGKNFQMFNTGSVEVEVAEFLYAIVRLLKPQNILDTGTHFGVSALYMGQACQDNEFGEVLTMEVNSHYAQEAKKLWEACGVKKIRQYNGESLKWKGEEKFDFMLLDTEPQIRFAELIKFYPHLNPGSFVFIHDLHRHMSQEPNEEHGFGHPFGKLPKEIVDWVKDHELWPFHFPTPRGLTGFYRPQENDFKWN